MKVSFNWLKKFLPTELAASEIADLLTHCGLEVEGMEKFESIPGGLKGLLVGEVITCVKHPNADKLSITTVNVGTDNNLQIVCGASNVAAGQKVIVATVGSTLYPSTGEPFQIKQSKIRSELSEGMICAEDEIGLGTSHEGIMVLSAETPVGKSAKDYFNIEEDIIFEIGLTPNRADAASHLGVARDLYAVLLANGKHVSPITMPSVEDFVGGTSGVGTSVSVQNEIACPRYSGLSISGVKVGDSPEWLQNRLKAIGLSPINNIVDVTNFVLHECGQPLHAFDAMKIKDNTIVVRSAKPGEKFVTLDQVERKLNADDLMICDASQPMCIAGVFGGITSGISSGTENIFIESAYFNPAYIRKTSKSHGLKTDASFRFERGTDPAMTIYALKRAAQLITEIAGGKISSDIVDIYPKEIKPVDILFSLDYLDKFSGDRIDRSKVKSILVSLGISIINEDSDILSLRIPTSKVDVLRPVDIVEEVLRIYGYNRIPVAEKMFSSLPAIVSNDREALQNKTADFLSSNGFLEILTNSLTKSLTVNEGSVNESSEVRLLNPLSIELDTLRETLLYSGLEVIQHNRNRKNPDLRLFEFGKVYSKSDSKYVENYRLALYITGRKFEISWNGDKSPVDFYFAKSFVENVLRRCKVDTSTLTSATTSDAILGNTLLFKVGEKELVRIGSVRKSLLKSFDINNEVFYTDFDWDLLFKQSKKSSIVVSEVSKFPSVRRDLSMMIDGRVQFSQIETVAYKTERKLLKAINLFDVYQGDKIEQGKKSYAVSFTLLDEQQTLTDKQIDKTMERLMTAFEKEVGAVIRKS
ncbi:MAG: phenylalanine--tRNA ligase subunit beta [Bacteroidia bacterium]|nr:phenylalanine--tRNA ligase subunit beta [Bacteroidia bacterium]